jgi:integrase
MTSKAEMRIAGNGTRSIPKRVAFTVVALERSSCPVDKERIWIYDTRQPGLGMMITGSGAKAFYVYRKVLGRPQRVRLGAFPDITIEQARRLARQTIGEISKGRDPMADRREARAKGMNLGELFKWFLETWAKPRKRSWPADETRYNTYLKPWANRRLTDISRADVAALHHRVSNESSKATANRVLALLSTIFNKARLIGSEQPNPCKGVEKFAEQSRERFLSAVEIKQFFNALEAEPDRDWKDFFKLCLYTGARRGNVLAMTWDEVDMSAGQWAIPGAKFKNGKPVVVHLPAPAIDVLKGRKQNSGDFVFPGPGKTGHAMKPEPVWHKLCERAGLADLRIHDLRRTLGSWQAAGGTSLAIIGKSLGHRSQQATAIYARLELDPVKQSVDAATAAMLVAAGQSVGQLKNDSKA